MECDVVHSGICVYPDIFNCHCNADDGGSRFLQKVCTNLPVYVVSGYAVAQLVEALCYKPEGCGFDSR